MTLPPTMLATTASQIPRPDNPVKNSPKLSATQNAS